MVSGLLELLEIMVEVIDFVCWTLGDIKNHSLLIGTIGGIRFLFVLRNGSEGLSSTDQVD